ncbi:MAG: DUF92 domain-containing protein [Firmicutes bacterium]|nr:DUF92 domain-containing protein [Bacillota bacterium]
MTDLLPGLALSLVVALAAWCKRSLSLSGLYAATVLGTLIYILGNWLFWAVLISFFLTSSLLSKFKSAAKQTVAADFAKTGRRDWLQVLANGSIGLAMAGAWYFSGNDPIYAVGYFASFAAVNADTWATELGILSTKEPLSILTLKPVAAGVSGAVSLLGTGAALAGAAFISILAALGLSLTTTVSWLGIAAVSAGGGFIGSLLDSVLGASVQAMYRCPVCGKLTEKRHHHGQPTELARGLNWFENDAVNWVCSLAGGVIAMALYFWL